MKEYKS